MPRAANTWEYSSSRVECRFGALDLLSDADPNSGVTIEPLTPVWREVLGCDGEVVRVRTSRFRCRVTVSLSQSCAAYASLLNLATADAVTGVGVRPFTFVDIDTGVTFVSPISYIEGIPTHQSAAVSGFSSWAFLCPYMSPAAVIGATTGPIFPI